MRKAMPMRWIEQAEARQVLTAALFERAPASRWSSAAGNMAVQILPRVRLWFGERHPLDMPVGQLQPAYVKQPNRRAGSPSPR